MKDRHTAMVEGRTALHETKGASPKSLVVWAMTLLGSRLCTYLVYIGFCCVGVGHSSGVLSKPFFSRNVWEATLVSSLTKWDGPPVIN